MKICFLLLQVPYKQVPYTWTLLYTDDNIGGTHHSLVVRQNVISKEHPVSGGGGVSGSRFNGRDG